MLRLATVLCGNTVRFTTGSGESDFRSASINKRELFNII